MPDHAIGTLILGNEFELVPRAREITRLHRCMGCNHAISAEIPGMLGTAAPSRGAKTSHEAASELFVADPVLIEGYLGPCECPIQIWLRGFNLHLRCEEIFVSGERFLVRSRGSKQLFEFFELR